jgi:hypothetical protein
MKVRYVFGIAAALVLILVVASSTGLIRLDEVRTSSSDPGFVPDTGQINPGYEPQPPSYSDETIVVPSPDQARAALMAPISKQPSTGSAVRIATTDAGSNASTSATDSSPSGPIGSVGETIPAKFSRRNAILDQVPTMAWPLALTDQQRKQIYDAVMASGSQSVADALAPASELSADQALSAMSPLPPAVRHIDGIANLYSIKGKTKVLLVEPATRTVVGEITD